jgi:60 kDa SS-A/Ro ribonucleoprotein
MRINVRTAARTHEGAVGVPSLSAERLLRRTVLSCLLWEDTFYEDGQSIANRIVETASAVSPQVLAATAIEAREVFHLRHAPLLLVEVLSRTGKGDKLVADTVHRVIQRADELGELVAMHHKLGGKRMLPAQMRNGLARALAKFDEHALAKYDRDGAVKLRDVLRLVRPRPQTDAQSALWRRVKERMLATPDTWEVALSAGADKRATFERLLGEGKLGYLALLRNLRNMAEAKVNRALVRNAILARRGGAQRVLPFRFVAAAKAAPEFERELDEALLANLAQTPKIDGRTVVVLDVSGSMNSRLSKKSELTRMQAAAALGAICTEVFSDVAVYATAGNDCTRVHATSRVPGRRGMALVDAICQMSRPLGGGGIFLKQVCAYLSKQETDVARMIVVTDEQDCGIAAGDSPLDARPLGRAANYLINVASYRNGIGYGRWTHIDGFSEAAIRYIREIETVQ